MTVRGDDGACLTSAIEQPVASVGAMDCMLEPRLCLQMLVADDRAEDVE